MTQVDGSATRSGESAGLVRRFDHVAIAVRDLPSAARLFLDLLGGELIAGGDDEDLRIRTVQLRFAPGIKVELIVPLDDGSYLQHYLDRHGPGFHHMTCMVDGVEDGARVLAEAGYPTVDTRSGTGFWDETFIRPSSAFGTLIQLGDSPLAWTEPVMPPGATLADVLAGRIVWREARPTWKEKP